MGGIEDQRYAVGYEAGKGERRLHLRTLLTVPFVLLILVPALLIAGSSLYTGLRAVDVLSQRLMDDISERVSQAASYQLEEAAATLRALSAKEADNFGSSMVLFADDALLERKFFEVTAGTRTTGYLYYGREDGSFVGVDRGRPGTQTATVRLKKSGWAPREIYRAQRPLDRSDPLEVEKRIYSPQERPWYGLAREAKNTTWSPVYVSFASQMLVTTVSQPVTNTNGQLLGVLAADVELTELSAFMKRIRVSNTGVASIVDHNGYLVAASTDEPAARVVNGQQVRISATESGSTLIRAAATWSKNRGDQIGSGLEVGSADVDGERVDFAVRKLSGVEGIDWKILVAVPRNDFTEPIVKSAISMFIVTLVALVAALLLGWWILRHVTSDVEALAKAAKSVSADGLPLRPLRTRLTETNVLADSFNEMVNRLRQLLETIRRQNEEYITLNASLEERVERRTTQLAEQNVALAEEIVWRERLERELRVASMATQKAAADKQRFLAILSHEVRTPLQAVIGTSMLLAKRYEGGDKPKELVTMDAAAKSLMTLIDGILSYSRLESGTVVPTPAKFNLKSCLEDALSVAGASVSRPAVQLVLEMASDVPQFIVTDEGMLRQILINLTGNALKFTEKGEVKIRVSVLPQQDPAPSADSAEPLRLGFAVVDTGRGISEETQSRLFNPFQQGGEKDGPRTAGTGLGLVICSMLVKTLGGEIKLSSALGQGTTVSFTVLAQATAEQSDALLTISDQGDKQMPSEPEDRYELSLLVVEDNDINRELLSTMLQQLGHCVEAAEDGRVAIEMALSNSGPFDVILMDLNLPYVSGVDAAQEIFVQSQRLGRRMPIIIALTASVSESDRAMCYAAGMSGFLTKPATMRSLSVALAEASALVAARNKSIDESLAFADKAPADEGNKKVTMAIDDCLDEAILSSLAEVDSKAREPFLRKLVLRFIEGQPDALAKIQTAIDAGDAKAATGAAHDLAGGAAMVGAMQLAEAARRMMADPKAELVDEIVSLSKKSCQALSRWADTLPT